MLTAPRILIKQTEHLVLEEHAREEYAPHLNPVQEVIPAAGFILAARTVTYWIHVLEFLTGTIFAPEPLALTLLTPALTAPAPAEGIMLLKQLPMEIAQITRTMTVTEKQTAQIPDAGLAPFHVELLYLNQELIT